MTSAITTQFSPLPIELQENWIFGVLISSVKILDFFDGQTIWLTSQTCTVMYNKIRVEELAAFMTRIIASFGKCPLAFCLVKPSLIIPFFTPARCTQFPFIQDCSDGNKYSIGTGYYDDSLQNLLTKFEVHDSSFLISKDSARRWMFLARIEQELQGKITHFVLAIFQWRPTDTTIWKISGHPTLEEEKNFPLNGLLQGQKITFNERNFSLWQPLGISIIDTSQCSIDLANF